MSGGGATLPGYENASSTEKSGWLHSPEARKLYMGTKKDPGPVRYALENAKQHAKMMQGVEDYDPNAWAKFTGMPEGSSGADISAALKKSLGYGSSAELDKLQAAAHGGVMNLQGFATGKKVVIDEDQAAFLKQMSKKNGNFTQAEKDRLNRIEQKTGYDVSPFSDAGTRGAPENPKYAGFASAIQQGWRDYSAQETAKTESSASIKKAAEEAGITPADAMIPKTAFFDPSGDALKGKYAGSTNPIYREALDIVKGLKSPEEYDKAGNIYEKAAENLLTKGKYTPEQVKSYKADVSKAVAKGYVPEKINPSNVRQVETEAYKPAASWTDKDMSSKYMSPYMQNVIDIQKREANRSYAQELQGLSAQAAGKGAFGGSRHAILEAEAARNQQQILNDIQAKGLQEAYTSGMAQFGSEQDREQTGKEAYAQRALDAAKTNMGRDLTIEEQNTIRQTAANEYEATASNAANAAYASAQNVASGNEAVQKQSADTANQAAGLSANAQDISALQGAGVAAAGLQGVGAAKTGFETGKAEMLGRAGMMAGETYQQYLDRIGTAAANIYGGTAAAANQGISALSGSAVGGTRDTVTTRNAKGGIIYAKR